MKMCGKKLLHNRFFGPHVCVVSAQREVGFIVRVELLRI